MWTFILFLAIAGYMAYNGFQVLQSMNGNRHEPAPVLFFFAGAMDFYWWVRKLF